MRALTGLRVVDLSRLVSGPYVGRILADLGADVVKIESPEQDHAEVFGLARGAHSGLYVQMNAGKQVVELDLRDPPGRDAAKAIAAEADVVIENFRPGVMDRLGVGYESISAVNPGVVVLSVSGFGAGGPDSDRRAFAPVIHAETSLVLRNIDVTGDGVAGDLPLALADTLAALHGTVAVLAALRLREATGRGQHIDLSMLDATIASDDHVHQVLDGATQPMRSRGLVWEAPGGPILLAYEMGATWNLLKRTGLTDREEMATAPQAVKFAARRELVADWIRSFSTRESLLAALDEAGIIWADLRPFATLLEQPTFVHRRPYDEIDDGAGGPRRVVRMPYRFSGADDAEAGDIRETGAGGADAVLARWSTRAVPPGAGP